jgi:hypothetical protein
MVAVQWLVCREDCCTGVRLASGRRLAHSAGGERQAALVEFEQTGQIDARGTRIGSDLLAQSLDIAKRIGDGVPQLTDALFNQAVFETAADFRDANFRGETQFDGAVFCDDAVFNRHPSVAMRGSNG